MNTNTETKSTCTICLRPFATYRGLVLHLQRNTDAAHTSARAAGLHISRTSETTATVEVIEPQTETETEDEATTVVCDHCGRPLRIVVELEDGTTIGRWCAGLMDGTRSLKRDRLKSQSTETLIQQHTVAMNAKRANHDRLAYLTELLTERATHDELAAMWLEIDD